MNLLDRTERQDDRRPYYCTWDRATVFFAGVIAGELVGILIMLIDLAFIWRVAFVVSTTSFYAALAIYYDKMRRGEPVTEKELKEKRDD